MKEKITKDWLFKKYIEEDKSQKEVSELTNYSRTEISRRLRDFNINKEEYKKHNDKTWLKQKYIREGLTQKEISEIVGVDKSAISKQIKKNRLTKGKEEKCPYCGEEYFNLSRHWSSSPSHRPNYTEKQKEIMIGSLMSDGWICDRNEGRKNRFQCEMIKRKYIEHLKNIFGVLCNDITKIDKEENQDIYRLTWKPHDFIDKLSEWYSTGEKVWPKIELTPTILRHYYVGDGSLNKRGGSNVRPRVHLGMANESGNEEKINSIFSMFSEEDYTISTRQVDDDFETMDVVFTVDGTEKFFDYIGEQELSGFEYKWR